MIQVVKIGGASLENTPDALARIREFTSGPLVLVHGGGQQITRMLERFGVQSQFIEGLRVTDEVTLASVAAALLGEVQTRLVAALQNDGISAVGLFGAVHAVRKSGPWGLVGTDVKADGKAIIAILESGSTPVIPTLALGPDSLLNVNGDETAAAVALAVRASSLIFLTDVEGVRNGEGTTIERVPAGASLVDAPFVSGGMKPKLRAVDAALAGGVATVRVGRTVFGAGVNG